MEIKGSKSVKAELSQICGESQDQARAKQTTGEKGGVSRPG
jgi:hypothetical protein